MSAVVLATHSAHKVREFQQLVDSAGAGIEVLAYDGPSPVEDGTSFAANALIKARTAAAHSGRLSLADDSGLSVDVLGGAPGIFSARWAGHGRGDVANRLLLLDQLADMADEHRAATFFCTIAMVDPTSGTERVVEGRWPGRLLHEERGEGGFGYDPIFLPEGQTRSAAELAPEEKNALSHRARAFALALPVLRELTGA
ncbi:RdgB/HAM1 family non-canonical purine NTP pyrophosphatase [Cnuibacter physcomitrellae]|uniref:RdgB/HAM1 family non-canonical purine NTP pyrophosphatase n=1 Tax=Cnuibacter physcomitrellae TaxID=1619308 RepID=UPI002175F7AC|nr:RdgB/HAM1 family non-canonical purine NTP pyrophosphatase [Cnuibacter physcomitrellae]MCS5496657.1 RdgB/HAM1 family non-canonical purine NTP pyrophosphatase [Cnuibacter physcomitrellae]